MQSHGDVDFRGGDQVNRKPPFIEYSKNVGEEAVGERSFVRVDIED